jgi:hypothetical protein
MRTSYLVRSRWLVEKALRRAAVGAPALFTLTNLPAPSWILWLCVLMYCMYSIVFHSECRGCAYASHAEVTDYVIYVCGRQDYEPWVVTQWYGLFAAASVG